MNLVETAKAYLSKSFSIIPINDKKQPTWGWQEYQTRMMRDDEIEEKFASALGIGIVCGGISGGREGFHLCVVDMDVKYFDEQLTAKQVFDAIPKELVQKLLIVKTISGGYHMYFRTPVPGKNRKLAMRETSETERQEFPNEKVKVLLETREFGGMVAGVGTPGYKVVSKHKQIPYITEEEHHTIFEACSSFQRVINEQEVFEKFNEEKKHKYLQSPFEAANERMNVLSLLQQHGYTTIGAVSGDEIKVKRSGNTNSTHSGYFKVSKNRYVNFSTSSQLDASKSYSASELYTILEHSGDWSAAYKGLVDMGYGISLDLNKNVREFVKAFREGNLEKLLKIHYDAKKLNEGEYQINGQVFKIKK